MAEEYSYWPPEVPPLSKVAWPKQFVWFQGQLLCRRNKRMVVAATGAVVITDRYQDEAGLVYCRVWYERDQYWQTVVIPLDALSQPNGMTALIKVGAPIVAPAVMRDFLWAWYTTHAHVLPTYQVPHQGGWWPNPDRYVWGSTVWRGGKKIQDDLFVLSEDARRWQTLQPIPSAWEEAMRKEWSWWLTRVLPIAPKLAIGLAAIGASLLLTPFYQPNFLLHIADHTSTGKTTTLSLLASCLGVPQETNGLVRKWQTDPQQLAEWVRWMQDTVWLLDDATRIPPGSLTDMVYWLTSGNPPWGTGTTHGIGISTSEQPMPSDPSGTLARVLSWEESWIPAGAPVEVWQRHVNSSPYWGWALGGLLLKYAMRNPKSLKKVWLRPPPENARGIERRWQGYWNSLVAGSMLWSSPTVKKLVLQEEQLWWAEHFGKRRDRHDRIQ